MKPTLPTCLRRQMTTRLVLFTLVLLGISQIRGFAQTIYNYTNASNGAPAFVAANVTGTWITPGAGVVMDPCGPTEGFGTEGWPTTNIFDVNAFNAAGDFVEFTLTPDAPVGLKITGISARSRRENLAPGTPPDGPLAIRYGYSINGGPWTTVNPGNPQASNLCTSGGVLRVWPAGTFPINTSDPITFRIYGLSSGSAGTGDLFLRDVVVSGEVCADAPSITPSPANFLVCTGETAFDFDYTLEDADTYSIDFDVAAEAEGFVDVPSTAVPDAPGTITWTIPAGAAIGDYNAVISVMNDCGFTTNYSIIITVSALPSDAFRAAGTNVTNPFTETLDFDADHEICEDGIVEYGAEAPASGPGACTFVWTISGGGTILQGVNSPNVQVEWTTSGIYTLTFVATSVATGCQSTNSIEVTVNALPVVTCPADFAVCIDIGTIFLETLNGLAPPSVDLSSSFSGAGVTPFDASLGLWEFSPNSAGLGTHTITYTYIDGNDCTDDCTFDITVNAIPDAYASDQSICSAEATALLVTNPNFVGGAFNWIADYAGVTGGAGSGIEVAYGPDAINETLINPTNASIVVKYTITPIGPSPTFCEGSFFDVFITVDPAPYFEFSAASNSDGPHGGNNGAGPSTLDIHLCAGSQLTLADYADNGEVGYTESYTTTGNVTEDGGGPLPLSSGPSNVAPAAAAGFFGAVYGGALGYGLTTGTSGTINKTFVPYLDNDASGTFTPGDCEGTPMYLNYHIHAIPTVTVSPSSDIQVCNGSETMVTFSGNYDAGVSYFWENDNTDIGVGTDGYGNFTFTATNTTNAPIMGNLTVIPGTDYCQGDPVNFTITVYPEAILSVDATVDGGPTQNLNNDGGPNSAVLNFCDGQSFSYSNFSNMANVCYLEEITGGSGNLYYGAVIPANAIPSTRPPQALSSSYFLGSPYGPYNLGPGETFGFIEETFTPFYDANGNCMYDDGDCLGETVTLIYKVYAPISLSITRNNPLEICSGDALDYTISTTSSQNVSFDLVLEENTDVGNPADLDDDNSLPVTLTGLIINSSTDYDFTQAINNAVGSFDRGQVRVSAINIGYVDADVCTTADVTGQNTQVYPEPRLLSLDPLLSCDESVLELDIDLQGLPSNNAGTAGYPVRIDWTLSAPDFVENGATGSTVIYDNAGLELNGGIDIAQILTLLDPLDGPQTATFTITPRASGPSDEFNGDDCYGDPITVVVTVVPPALPTITGVNTVHMGSQIQLTGTHNVLPPATVVSEVWSVPANPVLTVDNTGLVTGLNMGGPVTITYTVTDDAGCESEATHFINVIPKLELATIVVGTGEVACGDEVTVQVTTTNFTDIGSLLFNVNWDETKFELVTFSPTVIGGSNPTMDISWVANGDLNFFWIDGVPPYSTTLPPGTVILSYTLRAIGANGFSNLDISGVPIPIEAFNSSYYEVPVLVFGASVEIVPISLSLNPNPVVCPSDDNAYLGFSSYLGNPNHFFIDFDNCPLFPDTYEADFDPGTGQIVIPLMDGLQNGACNATLIVSNIDNGCVSLPMPFSIIIDQTDPTASNPYPLALECIADIPAPDANVVTDEDDDCTDPEDLVVVLNSSSQSGTGCMSSPLVINRVYSVTDEAGNTTYVTHTITVLDNEGPTVNTSGMATCYDNVPDAENAAIALANASKQDNCSPPVDITVTINTPTTFMGCEATIHLALTDGCGNVTLANFSTIVDSQDPVITNPAPLDDCYSESDDPFSEHYPYQDAVDAAILAVRLASSDNCTTDPNDLDITAVTSGTDCDLDIIVTVADFCGRTTSYTYNTRVESDPPIIYSNSNEMEGDCYNSEAEAIAAAIQVTLVGDDCTSPNDLQYDVYVLGGCPTEILVVVTDYCGNPASITYTGVLIDTEDPQVDPEIPDPSCYKTLEEAYAALAVAANPYDNCTSEADLLASVIGSAVEVGIFEDQCFEYDITLTFTDNCGNMVEYTFGYVVIDNTAPTAEALPDLVYACLSEVDEYDTNVVEPDDNCGVLEVVHIGDDLPTSCPGTGTRTYRVYDCAGNYFDVVQLIIINDDQLPSFTSVAQDLDRTCLCGDDLCMTAAFNLVPEVQDNCGEPSIVLESENYLGGCTGQYIRVWRAYDDCGNVSEETFTQTITIVDNQAPSWLTPSGWLDESVECSDLFYLNYLLSLVPEAEDACNTAMVTQVSQEFMPYLECSPYLGYYLTSFVATDFCGNESEPFYQYVYVYDITAPVWNTPEGELDRTISCEDVDGLAFAQSLEPSAFEYCTNATVVKYDGSFEPGNDCPQEGTYTNVFYAVDQCGNWSDPYIQVITIVDQAPPSWSTPVGDLDMTVECGDMYGMYYAQSVAPAAMDVCDPSISVVKSPGVLVPDNCPNTGTITNTWMATDDCGNESTAYTQVITIIDNTPPTVYCPDGGPTLPDDCYPSVAAAEAAAMEAIDPCDNCSDSDDLSITASTVGTCNAEVTVTVTDCAGNSASYTFYTRIDNEAPTMVVSNIATCYSSVDLAEAAAVAGTTITDNCDDYEDLDILSETTGTCPATITITATDACGNSRSVTYNGICIDGVPPVITTPASNLAVSCTPTLQADFQAWIDSHGGAVATGAASWYTIPAVPSLAGGCNGGTLVTFVASDNCGNTAFTSASFSFTDNMAPTASNLPPINVTCISAIPAPDPSLITDEEDDCDASPTVVHFADASNGGTGCANSPRIIGRTYSVTDDCGNTTYVTQMITAVDNVPPSFSAPANITLTVDAGCYYNASTAVTGDVTNESDNCSNGLNAFYTDAVALGVNTPDKFIITRTWQLVDACGNVAIPRNQIITVQDVILPTVSCPPSFSVTGGMVELSSCAVETYALPSLNALNPDDNCDPVYLDYELSGFFSGAASGSGNVPAETVFFEGETTITYTVRDDVGNETTCSFSITVNCVNISGRLIWEHDDVTGVGSGTVNLLNPGLVDSDITPASGNYSVNANGPDTYTIRPVKNINRMNGVTSADVTRIQQHLANNPPITDPYKKVCADVNHNGFITSQDVNLLQQALAGNTASAFDVYWRFVPTAYVMPSPTPLLTVPTFPDNITVNVTTNDITGQDFYGMKIGDVASPWANPAIAPNLSPLVWVLKDQILVAGSDIELTFAASNFNELASYQFALDFDPTQLQFAGFQTLGALPMNMIENFGSSNADLGQLRHVWAAANGATLVDGTPVFRARFKVLASGKKLSDVLKLDDSEIDCKAYTEAFVPTDVRIVFAESVDTDTPLDLSKLQLQLMQNRPNPFAEATTIGFILPEACDAHIRILDISGRELTSYDRKYTAGYHELEFRMENAASYGVLFCELVTPQGKRTIKMITAK
ncbi:MAG: cohesin domain-containing protein [Saprospiraceae bacterium]|nr:cohesin domain-containing protein [Saprospiraceae bacterium]